ncbi:hypothetical protein N9089_05425, partial [Crocinitomicaceae bacterium]|nr:hypothetical protein [Crocinitomicaceae bacterium]
MRGTPGKFAPAGSNQIGHGGDEVADVHRPRNSLSAGRSEKLCRNNLQVGQKIFPVNAHPCRRLRASGA